MAITITPRPNLGSGTVDADGFVGFGSGGFGEDDLLVIGDEANNVLFGGSGHDKIEGKIGNDIVTGGSGNDTIDGNEGHDFLDGQEGTDKLFGGPGNDALLAGFGFDQLTGGDGNDTFGFYALGHFKVQDFTVGEDRFFFDSQKLGVNNVAELMSFNTGINQTADGVTVEFGADASIELVGINLNDITAEMVVFNLLS